MVKSELGMIPQGWETVELRDVTLMINRGISPKYDTTSDNLVINQKCIRNKKLNLDEARRHLTKFPDQKLVQFSDVLINSTGVGTLGRVTQIYQVISDCTVDSHVTIVRPNKSIDIDFFGLQLLQQQSYFEGLGVGATGQTELGRETIAKTLFLQPPRKLQENFGAIVSPMRKSVIQLIERNANLCRTRDLLLPKLISGELDVSHWVDGDPGEIEVQEVMAKHTANKQLERAEPIDTKSLVWHSLWE
jgi:type I restriction enzyme S subunit